VALPQARDYEAALAAEGAITSLSVLQGEDHFSIVERLAEAGSPPTQALLNLIQ
jgi:hypothetical protein